MFLIFDFDEIAEGAEAGVLMGIKLLVFLALMSFPLSFLDDGGNVAIAMIGTAILLAGFYLNIVTLVNSIKKIKDKRNSENPYNHYEADYIKLKKNGKLVLIIMIIFSIIGLIFPIYINCINIKLGRIASMIFLPFVFNIIFYLMLNEVLHTRKKVSKSFYLKQIKNYIIDIFVRLILPISSISFFVYSMLWGAAMDFPEFKDTKFNIFMYKTSEFLTSQIRYYDEKYEKVRLNDFSITKSIEDQINYIKNIGISNPDIYVKVAEYNQPMSNTEYIANEYKENEPKFILSYFSYDDEFFEKYGLSIHVFNNFYQTEYENKYWMMDVYDAMYDKTYYYKYDYEQEKIVETYDNQTIAENASAALARELKK